MMRFAKIKLWFSFQALVFVSLEVVAQNGGKDVDGALPPAEVEETTPPGKPKACHKALSGANGLFATDGFPSPYAENSNCTWNITVGEYNAIKLTFHLMNVEPNRECRFDWVKVFDSNGTLMKRVCGSLQQDLIVYSSGNTLLVQFLSDSVTHAAGFFASWVEVPTNRDEETADGNGKPHYVFSFPQSIAEASLDAEEDDVCLQLIDVKDAGKADVKIFSGENLLNDEPSLVKTIYYDPQTDESLRCFGLQVPKGFKKQMAIVAIQGAFGDYNFLSYKSVPVQKASTLSLIQTDKYDYRPGQVVKFRLMIMDSELRPSKVIDNVDVVYIDDPQGNRIAQWKDVALERNGIVQLDMQLDDEPILGTYRINVKVDHGGGKLSDRVSFSVSENVLPKFEVTIKGPKHILRDTMEEKFEVCALYTHGGKVKGGVNVTFHSSYREHFWRAPKVRRELSMLANISSGGCASVTLKGTDLRNLTEKSKELNVAAVVKEGTTEAVQNATFLSKVMSSAFMFSFVGSSSDHAVVPSGGFPYVGRLRALMHDDKTPFPDVPVQICAKLFTSLAKIRDLALNVPYNSDEDQFFALGVEISKIKFKEVCEVYRTRSDGTVDFSAHLGTVPTNVTKLRFHVVAVEHVTNRTSGMLQPSAKFDVTLTHSNATTALTIDHLDGKELECTSNDLHVYFSAKPSSNVSLTWYFASGGAIVWQGEKTVPVSDRDFSSEYVGDAEKISFSEERSSEKVGALAKQTIKLELPLQNGNQKRVSDAITLLIYSRDGEGNVVTARASYQVKSCEDSPSIKWSKPQTYPGSAVALTIEAGPPNAVCGYSVVDKSVDLVKNVNKITKPRLQELRAKLKTDRLYSPVQINEDCQDAFKAFETTGLFVLSDLFRQPAECDTLIVVKSDGKRRDDLEPVPVGVAFDGGMGGPPDLPPRFEMMGLAAPVQSQPFASKGPPPQFLDDGATLRFPPRKPTVELRNYFPETWLFDMLNTDKYGFASFGVTTPHSISTWVASAVCTDETVGLVASNEAYLLVTQDFFSELILPHSVKRGEQFPLNVSVFNNVDQRLPIRLMVRKSDAYKTGNPVRHVCVDPQDNKIESFTIKALELDEVNVTVEARLTSKEGCGALDPATDGYVDALSKPVKVKPEGFPMEKTQTEFVCKKEEEYEIAVEMEELVLPYGDNLVEGSARAWLTVSGDIMAPSLSNLGKLVRVPTGCGEQNMMRLVPNIYLLTYLQGKGISAPTTVAKAKQNMKIGYERQQKYRFKDGSYSVWGPSSDDEGSIWLTSFVVKSFVQASKFISISQINVEESIGWILLNQNKSSGCFIERGFVIHEELKGSKATLTASILVTLIEVQSMFPSERVSRGISQALACIKEFDVNDRTVYNKALVAYATSLHASDPGLIVRKDIQVVETAAIANELINDLIRLANDSLPGKLFWTTGTGNSARDVEVTAYVVLSLVVEDRLSEALKAIRWLSTQRNSRGGFVSTQDTMIALQAIAAYSSRIRKTETNLFVSAKLQGSEKEGPDKELTFEITEENELLFRKEPIDLPSRVSKLKVAVTGNGCFMLQSILRYNVKNSPDKEVFQLTAALSQAAVLTVCSSYRGEKKATDMVVIEIEQLSGFVPVISSLEALSQVEGGGTDVVGVRKYEYEEKDEDGLSRIFLYFDQMAKKENCWKIELKRETIIEELKDAVVKIYDYYDPKETFSILYNI